MRSPLWFVVAGVMAVAALVGAWMYLTPRLAAAGSDLIRVVVPGAALLELDKPGRYVIYHEKNSTVDGRYYASDRVDGLQLRLTSDTTGEVKMVEPEVGSRYSFGNRSGTSIFAFTVDGPGRYRLVASVAGGRDEPKAVLAIGQGTLWGLFRVIMGTLAIAFGGIGVALALVLVVLWRRSKVAKTAPG
jgi:hypothetical protein